MTTTRIHRVLQGLGSIAFPGVFDTLSAKICQQVGLSHGLRVRLFGGRHHYRRAGHGPAHADRNDRAGKADLHERGDPRHRRRRHRLRQPAERLPHGPGVDRGRGGRLLPRRPGVAEEVRPHAGQTGGRPPGVHPQDPRGLRSPRRTATSSSSPAPTPWPSTVWTRRSRGLRPRARRAPTRALSKLPDSVEQLAEIGRRAAHPTWPT